MKKTFIVLGVMVFTLTLGLAVAGIAYAGDDWTPFSADNNLGILLYNDIHAPVATLAKCEIRNFGSGEIPMIKDEVPAAVASAGDSLGILLYNGMEVSEARGSGAGGVSKEATEKCVTGMVGTGKNFDDIYVHSVTVRPF